MEQANKRNRNRCTPRILNLLPSLRVCRPRVSGEEHEKEYEAATGQLGPGISNGSKGILHHREAKPLYADLGNS